MNKLGRVYRSPGCVPLAQESFPRLGRGFEFPEVVLLLIFTLTLASCDSSGDLPQGGNTETQSGSVQKIAFSRDVGGQLDLFAINEDGTGGLVTLANDPGDEVFGGSTSDNRVIYVRDTGGGLNDIFSITDDGSGVPITLTNDPTDELPVAVTAANEVIFMRSLTAPSSHTDLLSVSASGGGITPLATSTDIELFGGLTSDGWVVYERTDGLFEADLYSISADGISGTMPLSNVAGEIEAGGGIANGTLVVFARTLGGLFGPSNIYTIEANGLNLESPLVATGDNELPIGVTADDIVIFTRTTALNLSSLMSIGASGIPGETLLATSDVGVTADYFFYGGATGGRVIYHRCDFFEVECDVFSRNIDASDPGETTLAGDPLLNEVFVAVSSDGRVIIVRDNGDGTTDLLSSDAAGVAPAIVLTTETTPAPPGEVFKGVTANGRVIFERDLGGQIALFSINADGSAPAVRLHTDVGDEFFGGIF